MGRVGNQIPTYTYCAPWRKTQGNIAVALSNSYSMRPHPWQRTVLDDWLATDDNGKLLNSLCLMLVNRQNGKTGCADPRETEGLVVRGERILHTAHEFQTSQIAFDRLRAKFGECRNDPHAKYPELNRLVKKYTVSQGQMVLDLTNGGHIEFRTRGKSGNAGRGGTFDLVVVDEAQIYTDAQDAALSPLNSAAPTGSPQTILMGTVPNPEKPVEGEVFTRLLDMAHKDPYEGMCIHEWSAPEVGDPMDEDRWYRYNPSLGYQLLPSALMKDARGMSAQKFAQEHLGWRGMAKQALNPISSADWDACAIRNADVPRGRYVYAVKFAPDGMSGVIAVAVIPDDDAAPIHVEVAELWSLGRGTSVFAEYVTDVAEFAECVVIDGKSNAQSLVDRALDRGMDEDMIVRPSTNDAISAYTGFVDAVRSRAITHNGDESLGESAKGCVRRRIGTSGGYGFEGKGNADATMLEAVALAHWKALDIRRGPVEDLRLNL